MTGPTRFERELPTILGDLAMGPTPDYIDDVLGRTVRMRQRPAWASLERWISMADIASRPAFAQGLPWRTIGVALVILALLVALAVAFAGTRQTKLPLPFGPAANGLIAYSKDGDVYTVDPASGGVTSIIAGPDTDTDPVFSPDGTRLAFLRTNVASVRPAKDIVVTGADGSNPLVVNTAPIRGGPSLLEWVTDSRSLLASAPNGSAIWLYDAASTADPRTIATNAEPYLLPGRRMVRRS